MAPKLTYSLYYLKFHPITSGVLGQQEININMEKCGENIPSMAGRGGTPLGLTFCRLRSLIKVLHPPWPSTYHLTITVTITRSKVDTTMSDANTLKRQLKIKSGAAKRLLKENGLYRKEAQDLLARREKLIADGVNTDEWEVKNATNMYEESNKMIRDSSDRLLSVIAELKELVNAAHKEAEFAEDVELKNAESILREASS
ncbi:tubulin-specific chaperone a [Moniliophthora roreri]|nr:tubulin-specific chaperone a [Moniliophthora roreri]